MDPVSAVGLVSSVAQLIETTVKVIGYVNDVGNAPVERAQFARHASSLLAMLTDLRYRVDEAKSTTDAWFTALRGLGSGGGPLDQLRDQLERLATKLDPPRGRLKKVGRALIWTLDKKEIDETLAQIERVKTLVMLALQNDQFKLTLEMKQDLIDVKGDLRGAIDGANAARQDEELQKVTAWLSSLDFAVKQVDFLNRRQVGTGEWFFSDPRFEQWLAGKERILWCPGLRAGKTILSSIVIDWLERQHPDTDIAVTYIYCNYKEKDIQTAQNLIGSLLKQVVQHRGSVPADVLSLYNNCLQKNSSPRLDELSRLLLQAVNTYSQVFVVIDALDECPEGGNTRSELLTEIQKLPSNARILITSRYSPKIDERFENVPHIEIRATDQDVERYIKARIEKERSLATHVLSDRALMKEVVETVVERSQGMFLLAQLHMDNLARKLNRRQVRTALGSLPKNFDDIYDQAMERIQNQDEDQAALAHKVLYWISYSLRPFTVTELQHALAVEPGDDDLDEDGLYDPEFIVSVCAGLVTVEEESHQIRLVHYTTQSYFERIRTTLFPEAPSAMAKACLTYLSFNPFTEKYSSSTSELETRLNHYPFLRYAASYWGHHVRDGMNQDVCELALGYLSNNISILNTIQASERVESRFRLNRFVDTNFTRLHAVAWFGLVEIARDLLVDSVNLNARAYDDLTPLHLAAERGHTQMVSLLLKAGAEVAPETTHEITPLHIAAQAGHHSVVQVLIDAGADCNDCIASGRLSPLHVAVYYGHIDVARVLMKNGADVNQKHEQAWLGKYGGTPLIQAAEHGDEALVLLLLNNGADISATQEDGLTALHVAAGSGYGRVVEMFISRGIDISIKDKEEKTALHHATESGHDMLVGMLISRGIDISTKDKLGKTALHHAAERGQAGVAQILLKNKANPLTEDHEGNTAFHEAVVSGHEEVLKLLLEHMGRGNETERWLATIRLRRAVDKAEKDEVRSLLEKGANPNLWGKTEVPLLHLAIVREDADVLQLLLTNQANVSMEDSRRMTPLHWAACRGYDVGVQLLLEHGADIQAADLDGATPLHWAAGYGSASVVKRLLDDGSLPHAKDKGKLTALDWLLKPDSIAWSTLTMHMYGFLPERKIKDEEQGVRRPVDILDLLIEKGADLNEPLPSWDTILSLAVKAYRGLTGVALIRRALEAGADVTAQTDHGEGALYVAAAYGDIIAVQFLLEHGADPNQGDKRNMTALHEAALDGNVEMARLLIEAGADVEAANERGITVLHYAVDCPLEETAAVIDLLLAHGVDINAHYGDKKATVLHQAAMNGNVATVQFLLERGADIAATDVDGMTALDWAKESGHEAMIFLLSRHSAPT